MLKNDLKIEYYGINGTTKTGTLRAGSYEVNITGYHTPSTSNYTPSGTEASKRGLVGNDALAVDRASSIKNFLIKAGVKNIVTITSGGVSPKRKVTITKSK